MMDDLYYWMALHLIPGIGGVTYRQLIKVFGTPEEVFKAKETELTAIKGIRSATIEAIRNIASKERAAQELKLIRKYGVRILTFQDGAYPQNLANIYDAPALLYIKGNLSEADTFSVAVVGSRHATYYGQKAAEGLCRSLAGHGLTIVSGMARGIDTAAHLGALRGKGRTIAVLGSGLDIVYPEENKDLYHRIIENGAVISEYPLGTPPEPKNFPIRNRIISGLALGTVIVEATGKSGSLITANLALEQGREVFAVPGSINSLRSTGTHKLIKQGAKLVESAEDIVEELRPLKKFSPGPVLQGKKTTNCPPACIPRDILPEERDILALVEEYPQHIDELVRRGNLVVQKVSSILLNLELKGLVQQLPGKLFVRK
ncbi:MAG: DNA-processing protein DprA [Thermodesulfobacteriota bacterium]